MPPSLFFEVVLPLLEVDKTSMLAISTPSPEGNMNFCKCFLVLPTLFFHIFLTWNSILMSYQTQP